MMESRITSRIIYFFLALGLAAGVMVILYTQNSYGGGDNFSHYKFAHWGWKYPNLLFDHWGKPVFTLLASPFAQMGINGVRVYNLLMGFLTALIIGELANHFNFKNRAVGILLVLFTPVYFIMMFTSLTEVTFSFFLALGVWLFFKEKYIFSAVIWSFLPIIRSEGFVLFPLFILVFGLKKQFFALPLLSAGFWLISFLGNFFYDDFWWLITNMPYVGNNARDIYGSGSLLHYIHHTEGILGYPMAGLFVIGFGVMLHKWVTSERRKLTSSLYFLILIPGSFFTFLAAHSFVWWLGTGSSLGLVRVMASVTPLVALTALPGFNFLESLLKEKNKGVGRVFVAILLAAIVWLGINSHLGGFRVSREDRLMDQAGDFILKNKLDRFKLYYFSPHLIGRLGVDPFDRSLSNEGLPDRQNPGHLLPDSSIVVWDAHFGPNEGGIPLEKLKQNDRLVLIKEFKPDDSFKVLGGYDYAIYIFQRIPEPGKTIND